MHYMNKNENENVMIQVKICKDMLWSFKILLEKLFDSIFTDLKVTYHDFISPLTEIYVCSLYWSDLAPYMTSEGAEPPPIGDTP